jgi:hypothetical protein
VFVATGRGTNLDAGSEEHHEQRRQYTVAQARDES